MRFEDLRAMLRSVASEFGVSVEAMRGPSRRRPIPLARHVAAWIMRREGVSLHRSGALLGGRHHTTVLYGVQRVDADRALRERADALWSRS